MSFFFSSRRRHTRCALVTGVQTCALPIGAPRLSPNPDYLRSAEGRDRLREIYGVALGDPVYQPERRFDAKERTFAGYIQAKYEVELGGPLVLDGVIGVRPTLTDRQIEGAGDRKSTRLNSSH